MSCGLCGTAAPDRLALLKSAEHADLTGVINVVEGNAVQHPQVSGRAG